MKLDGVTMETTEPTDAAAVVEPENAPDDNATEQSPAPPEEAAGNGVPKPAPAVNGKTTATAGKTKPTTTRKQAPTSRTDSASGSRAAATSRRPGADVKPTNNVAPRNPPAKKPLAPKPLAPGTAAPPKKNVSTGSASTTKTPVKIPEKKPPGPASGATANGTRPSSAAPKKTTTKPRPAGPVPRPTGSTAAKAGTSTSTRPDAPAPTKTTRAATAPPTSRAAAKPPSATTAATKPPSTVRTPASRAATAPPSGRSTTAPPNKAAGPAKKDVSRPPAAVVRKAPAAAKKAEVSKPAANVKPNATSTNAKVDPKLAPKPNTTKTSTAAAARVPAATRLGPTPPASPAGRAPSAANTPRSKLAHKPTQAVSPFTATKRPERTGAAKAAKAASDKTPAARAVGVAAGAAAGAAVLVAAAVVQDTQAEPVTALPKESTSEAPGAVEGAVSAPCAPLQTEHATAPDKSPLRTTSQIEKPPCDPSGSTLEPPALLSPVSPPLKPENGSSVTETQTSQPPTSSAAPENEPPLTLTHNLNEDEDEEEKEGSQLVSISEMSGTTQPTEESRPGSAGPAGASAWRVGGALLSELDSEEVSVSPHGASEFSAPGLLEGTESMDDLGEGSLKGAMDMEGASAGSPDFERVPEIPVNYDEDDEDEDMDVGSERADEPQRHDNDVDDEEDEDVEMASEGVTESGLESYGNADEDDFAEDERLDNLNRVVQPPPPPLLPSAPAAQWDQPNPFSDPWAEPVPLQPPPEAESPLTDPCQGDSETPTQESAQAWLELGSTANENHEDPHTELQRSAEPTLSGASPEEPKETAPVPSPQPEPAPSAHAPGSNPSSSSVTEDEASDTEGEAQLDDSLETPVICNVTIDMQPHSARCLSTVDEGEELEDSATPPSATSLVSYGFDTTTSASNSNAQSTGESCVKSPGTFSLEELPEEAKEPLTHLPPAPPSLSDQPYIQCGQDHEEQAVENKTPTPEKGFASSECGAEEQVLPLDDLQPPYYSAICEKTENFAGNV